MTTTKIPIPGDVIKNLKRFAALLGFSRYFPLVRAYLKQGLRAGLERLEGDTVTALIASLKRHSFSEEILREAEVTQLYL